MNQKNKINEYIFIYIITEGVHITLDPTLITQSTRIQKNPSIDHYGLRKHRPLGERLNNRLSH